MQTAHTMKIMDGSVPRARALRKRVTTPEKILWQKLRAHRFHHLKFRRQVPIGPYIADFACIEKKLIIEIDGGGHLLKQDHDVLREMYFLYEKGLRTIRFTNGQIRESLHWVMETIGRAAGVGLIAEHPLPDPLPRGEGELCTS